MEQATGNRSIQKQSTQQLSQALPRNNNEVQIKRRLPLSVFGFDMPAGVEYIAVWAKKMSIAFPNKPAEFWGLVSQKARSDGYSERRLEYIYQQLSDGLKKVYDISDIFRIDKPLKTWADELNSLKPYKHFAVANVNGKNYCMTIEDAEMTGLKYRKAYQNEYNEIQYINN